MCFTIPYQIVKADETSVTIEDGRRIMIGQELTAQKGDYVQLVGEMAVGVLSRQEGKKIRQLIRALNS